MRSIRGLRTATCRMIIRRAAPPRRAKVATAPSAWRQRLSLTKDARRTAERCSFDLDMLNGNVRRDRPRRGPQGSGGPLEASAGADIVLVKAKRRLVIGRRALRVSLDHDDVAAGDVGPR